MHNRTLYVKLKKQTEHLLFSAQAEDTELLAVCLAADGVADAPLAIVERSINADPDAVPDYDQQLAIFAPDEWTYATNASPKKAY